MRADTHLDSASVDEVPKNIQIVPVPVNFQLLKTVNWQKRSLGAAMGFVSATIFLGMAGQALAIPFNRGDKGPEIEKIQRCLQKLGHFNNQVNGSFGQATEDAVKKFQESIGYKATGFIGPQTHEILLSKCQGSSSTPSTSSTGVLKKGSSSPAVTKLQDNLTKLGYYKGSISGFFAEGTEQAVSRFQKDAKLPVNGVADQATQNAIQAALKNTCKPGDYPKLEVGNSGACVTRLQKLLNQRGYTVPETGNFGEKTKQAVISFQQKSELAPSGIVDATTWKLLDKISPTPTPSKPVLKEGDQNESVARLQRCLSPRYINFVPTGYFGSQTTDAVKKFQRDNELLANGVVNEQTRVAVERYCGGRTSSSSSSTIPSNNRFQVLVPLVFKYTVDDVRICLRNSNAGIVQLKGRDYVKAGEFSDYTSADLLSKRISNDCNFYPEITMK
jgi:peptidoglycan hydrolase-like protein with peptidoglycan-binding domain